MDIPLPVHQHHRIGGEAMEMPYGGYLERGVVLKVSADGARIASYDRPGIVTKPLKALFRKTMEAGWNVLFMEFEDGSGIVISHQNPEITRAQDGILFATFDLVDGCLIITTIEPEFRIDENGKLEVTV